MCGIVGVVSTRPVGFIMLEGLQRLEYRGYDSAGLAVVNERGKLERIRRVGKVAELRNAFTENPIAAQMGIAHTRWATHGKPSVVENAHPHLSRDQVAVVHNGIIENHDALRTELAEAGYVFESQTDTEVLAHLIHQEVARAGDFEAGVRAAVDALSGAYAMAVVHSDYSDRIIALRSGSPLVVGVGIGENFVASDVHALRSFTDKFVYLDEGEFVEIALNNVTFSGTSLQDCRERIVTLQDLPSDADKGKYRHYMQKEIFEQPSAIRATLQGRVTEHHVLQHAFGTEAHEIFAQVEAVQIIACGTSLYAGMVARYWFERYASLPCQVEIASEFRYRSVAPLDKTLLVTISQSGETADTLEALRGIDDPRYLASLTLCNVAGSTLVRESDLSLMIEAGPEIGVASTKAFTTQLADLMLLVVAVCKAQGLPEADETGFVQALRSIPDYIEQVLSLDKTIAEIAERFIHKQHALFLGRGEHYPVALEGALKLKEISYVHAEGYAAGELKHGPLALVDEEMPVVAVAPNDDLLGKVKSNLQEVSARGGKLYILSHIEDFEVTEGVTHILMPDCPSVISPIVYTVPLQLLAYHVAVLKGTDVDQPRNLAKSVTVE